MKRDIFLAVLLICVAVTSRALPHLLNFTAVGAAALVAGYMISSRWMAISVPLVALLLSDLVLGFHDTVIFVYTGFALMTGIAMLPRTSQWWMRFLILPVVASASFFLLTNFGAWYMDNGVLYSRDLSGLLQSYVSGIPFYRTQLASDLVLTPVVFLVASYLAALWFQESSASAAASTSSTTPGSH
jgi:hypothetical protein